LLKQGEKGLGHGNWGLEVRAEYLSPGGHFVMFKWDTVTENRSIMNEAVQGAIAFANDLL
jgi:hypothetical protein